MRADFKIDSWQRLDLVGLTAPGDMRLLLSVALKSNVGTGLVKAMLSADTSHSLNSSREVRPLHAERPRQSPRMEAACAWHVRVSARKASPTTRISPHECPSKERGHGGQGWVCHARAPRGVKK